MVALSSVRPGSSVRVKRLDVQPDAGHRLREMGIREETVIRCLQPSPCVCLVERARVGLSSHLAGSILVEPLA